MYNIIYKFSDLTGIDYSEGVISCIFHTTTDRVICPGSKRLLVPVLEPGQGRRDKNAEGFCPG